MPFKLIVTKDGSHTIEGAGGITYHSTFGALRESRHIFIEAGLRAVPGFGATGSEPGLRAPGDEALAVALAVAPAVASPLRVFEMGLGTGLNALLTMLVAADTGRPIVYEAAETTPLPLSMIRELNYCRLLGRPEWEPLFERLHTAPWETPITLHPNFSLFKTRSDGAAYTLREPAGLVYYDAFDPVTQPELWTPAMFEKLYRQLAPGALLVTYCCKGSVQRALRSAGFVIEKLPGPPGKREILRAKKAAPGDGGAGLPADR
ncbi:MAG TPA: tRNA (5-methylaminomethyl-2-thiouridine)(34)-methyltransferase MnmD [Puia sp.]|nr:tRNA (5-methylaminomethyl-2-thiouridine)(34)-methyltransferase MnmD [Puia sp.]